MTTTQPSLDGLRDISLENKLIIKDLLRSQQKELLERVRMEIRINRNTFDLGSMYSGQEYVLLEDIDKALDAIEREL